MNSTNVLNRPLQIWDRSTGPAGYVRVSEVSHDGHTITVPTQARYQLEIQDVVVAYPKAALHEDCTIPGCLGAPHSCPASPSSRR